jgi:SAM-dependent methyltransferase
MYSLDYSMVDGGMMNIEQHQKEILQNKRFWESKRLLRTIYKSFYKQIITQIDHSLQGKIIELGSGVGNLKSVLPHAICTDLFPNPWLDAVCSAYAMPFENGSVSHLVLFDVFHHLERPNAFLREARRVLTRGGRVIIFEPYMSTTSMMIYGLFHHEPIAWKKSINYSDDAPSGDSYYAAQGNATRLFFQIEAEQWLKGWKVFHKQPMVSYSYLLSGGYSKPALYPEAALPLLQKLDALLTTWPSLFAARCLIGLTPE